MGWRCSVITALLPKCKWKEDFSHLVANLFTLLALLMCNSELCKLAVWPIIGSNVSSGRTQASYKKRALRGRTILVAWPQLRKDVVVVVGAWRYLSRAE